MKNILLFTDYNDQNAQAAKFALWLAATMKVRLFIWNTFNPSAKLFAAQKSVAGFNDALPVISDRANEWIKKLTAEIRTGTGLKPLVQFIDRDQCLKEKLLAVVRKEDIGLLVKQVRDNKDSNVLIDGSGIYSAMRTNCPILLVPEKLTWKSLDKILYVADLRYCRKNVVRLLGQLAAAFNASVTIADLAAKGMPYLEDNYAREVYHDAIDGVANQDHFYLSHIRERNIPKAIDVLVNDLKADLLVLVNKRYHFNELLGSAAPYILPAYIHIPVMIFPS